MAKSAKTCKDMTLQYLKQNSTSCTFSDVTSGVENMFEYNNQAAMKRAVKKMLDDDILVTVAGEGITGSFKVNPTYASKKKTATKKRVSIAKTKLKQKPKTLHNMLRAITKEANKNLKQKTTKKPVTKAAKKPTTNKKKAKKSEAELALEPQIMAVEARSKKGYIRRQLYRDLIAIGADEYLTDEPDIEKGYTGGGGGNCFLAALTRGHYTLDPSNGKAELDRIIYEDGKCDNCGSKMTATVRDLLQQQDYGGACYGDGGMKCQNEDCDSNDYGYYVTGLCQGRPSQDEGKFHNHCNECKGLGACIGDYRSAHCGNCGKHYFAGNSGFDCPCQERFRGWGDGGSDSDGYDDGHAGNCTVM